MDIITSEQVKQTDEGKQVYERFKKYLNLVSHVEPNKVDIAQYITDMHKIALHENTVMAMGSEALPFHKRTQEISDKYS